jgi:Leucine-rich repeat (LRR) protein
MNRQLIRTNESISEFAELLPSILLLSQLDRLAITTLNLHSNKIVTLDQELLQYLPNLTTLDLSSNRINTIQSLESLVHLTSLNLSNNKVNVV